MLATSSVELTNRVEFVTTLGLRTPLIAQFARDPRSNPLPKTCTSRVESTVAVSGLVDLTVTLPAAASVILGAKSAEGGAPSVHAENARRPRIRRRPCENE